MASMNEKDYYAILEVEDSATTDEIRRAFQKKARKLHPDVNKEPDAEERFKEVSEAYAVLSDADKRARYDAMRSGSGSPFAGGYPGAGTSAGGYGSSPFDGFPFGGAWGRRSSSSARSYRPRAGADFFCELELDAATAREGMRRGFTYTRYSPCEVCNGTGSVEHSEPSMCPTCAGVGRMRVDLGGMGLFGIGFLDVTCPECEGTGKVVVDPCVNCGGSGRIMQPTEIVVGVPKNSHDGDEVRVAGMGNAGTNGREAGDFVCTVRVAEERLTQRQETGFRFIGFALPFILVGVMLKTMGVAAIGAALASAGLAMVISDGVKPNARWLKNGVQAIVGALLYGTLFAFAFLNPFLRGFAVLMIVMMVFSLMSTRRIR